MADSVPPSAPPPSSNAPVSARRDAVVRARIQMAVALFVGFIVSLVLFGSCLRKGKAPPPMATPTALEAGVDLPSPTAVELPPDAAALPRERGEPGGVTIEGPVFLACGDSTSKPPKEPCDRLPAIEKALAQAIEDTKNCAASGEGGAIVYVFDLHFKRTRVAIAAPKEGRTLRDAKVVSACVSAIKAKLAPLSIESAPHVHPRYRLSFTANYNVNR